VFAICIILLLALAAKHYGEQQHAKASDALQGNNYHTPESGDFTRKVKDLGSKAQHLGEQAQEKVSQKVSEIRGSDAVRNMKDKNSEAQHWAEQQHDKAVDNTQVRHVDNTEVHHDKGIIENIKEKVGMGDKDKVTTTTTPTANTA